MQLLQQLNLLQQLLLLLILILFLQFLLLLFASGVIAVALVIAVVPNVDVVVPQTKVVDVVAFDLRPLFTIAVVEEVDVFADFNNIAAVLV